jgi:hypothetical protein
MKLNFHETSVAALCERWKGVNLPESPGGHRPPLQRIPQSAIRNPQSGIALVITLILLSVTAFMTITFLILSQRERGAVSVEANQTDARLAAETAVQQATARLVSSVIAFNNGNDYDLLVSTNYINPAGFITALPAGGNQLTNVSYTYENGAPLDTSDMQQNLNNLLYDPRPPVFVTNPVTGSNDFRYYLDLNRNGEYDTNGYLPVMSTNPAEPFIVDGAPSKNAVDGHTLSNFFVGDPEWIGVLERPDQHHSSSNRFIARYAYIVLPAGKSLDLNYIHNYSKRNDNMISGNDDGYMRNEGVGSWEINLAAFLADLNTNFWPMYPGNNQGYYYTNSADPLLGIPVGLGKGFPFDDALSLLSYRYATNYTNLAVAPNPNNFRNDDIDEYSDGPLMTNTTPPNELVVNNQDNTNAPWSGSDNPTHYFTPQELFDGAKTSANFTNRLMSAGTNFGSYDRYTFYRMLAQLGTDTAPEHGKVNVNYVNVDANGNIVPNLETNYASWVPIQFFTNVAPRLLTNYFGIPAKVNGGTNLVCYGPNGALQFNIEIYPTNYYTPAVHRLLQLTANLYDATTNNGHLINGLAGYPLEPRFPTVFRPIFGQFITATTTNICITNYVEETNAVYETPGYTPLNGAGVQIRDVNDTNPNTNPATGGDSLSILGVQSNDIVYGIPLVIGARQGLPNFQEFAMLSAVTATRELQFVRAPGDMIDMNNAQTNVLYNLSISNTAGIEAWNAYSNAYPRGLQMTGAVDVAVSLFGTNAGVPITLFSNHFFGQNFMGIPANSWTGYAGQKFSQRIPLSFQCPFFTNNLYDGSILTGCTYHQNPMALTNLATGPNAFESNLPGGMFPVPHWSLHQNTRVRYMLVDTNVLPNRIVDYVSLSAVQNPVDITLQLQVDGNGQINSNEDLLDAYAQWTTNRNKGANANVNVMTMGIFNQIGVNLQPTSVSDIGSSPDWVADVRTPAAGNDVNSAKRYFSDNLSSSPAEGTILTNVFYTPYDPTRMVFQNITWEANDPLVHYTVGDLVNTNTGDPLIPYNTLSATSPGKLPSTSSVSYLTNRISSEQIEPCYVRYQPWGGNFNTSATSPGPNDFNIAVKDPLIALSDDWQFPTNKLPGIGWIGQVHRGSPWQTIYLKPALGTNVFSTWTNWAGDSIITNLFTVPSDTNAITNAWTNGWKVFISSNTITRTNVDAALTVPTNDWSLFDLLTAAPNDNATRGQLSVNQTNVAAWSAVLSGVVALDAHTNPVIIQPAASAIDTNLQMIVDGINRARAGTNFNGTFNHLGDVLSTPELTVNSPYLGGTNAVVGQNTTINDAILERIPQQVLSLLRGKETRFVVYAYGQSLAPAPRSLTSSGLCQNYQITGEVAVRAVIRVDGPAESPHTVVESFNYLPPNE